MQHGRRLWCSEQSWHTGSQQAACRAKQGGTGTLRSRRRPLVLCHKRSRHTGSQNRERHKARSTGQHTVLAPLLVPGQNGTQAAMTPRPCVHWSSAGQSAAMPACLPVHSSERNGHRVCSCGSRSSCTCHALCRAAAASSALLAAAQAHRLMRYMRAAAHACHCSGVTACGPACMAQRARGNSTRQMR